MEKIVNLSDYRKPRAPSRRALAAAGAVPHYVCLRCETAEFKLYSSGMVHCAHCGALMRNLLVSAHPTPQNPES